MFIYNVSQCTITEIHQMIHIIRWIQYQRRDLHISKKSLLVNWLISSIWNDFSWNRLFCKDTLMLTRKRSDSIEETDTPLIKLSSSPEMTRSKMWPCLCVLSWTCCLRLVDLRMSASCYVSAFLWQSQCILKSPKINRWPLVTGESTNPKIFLEEICCFQAIFLTGV